MNFGDSFDSVFTGFGFSEANNPIYVTKNGYIFIADPILSKFHGIIRSTNEGLNWQQVLFDKSTYTVFAKEDGLVITGGRGYTDDDSVYISSNFGDTWHSIPQPIGIYNYISDIKEDGSGNLFFGTSRTGLFEIDIINDLDEEPYSSNSYFLSQNYPNPFTPTTKIKYSVTSATNVQIKVYNILGKEVNILINEHKNTGNYEIEFDGSALPSGVYFYKIQAGSFVQTKKMIILR